MVRIVLCSVQASLCGAIRQKLIREFGKRISVIIYESGEALSVDYLEQKKRFAPDILLTDTVLEAENGIELAEKLQKVYPHMRVIFLADCLDDITEIFRLNPSNFLLKPVTFRKLTGCVLKIMDELAEADYNYYVVTFKGKVYKVRSRDILYLESEKRRVTIYGREENWVVYRTLNEIQEKLPGDFLRCHQSYLVNMNEIRLFKPFQIEMQQGAEIPVSRGKYKETKEYYREFTGKNGMDVR